MPFIQPRLVVRPLRLIVVPLVAALAALGACGGAAPPPAPPPLRPTPSELAVPAGDAPAIDGKVDDAAWARAAAVPLDRGVTLRLLHDGARVYLAVSGLDAPDEFAFACLLVAEPSQVRVLHASAKLGSAIYTPGTDGRYQPRSKEYNWRPADDLMRDEGWMATTVSDARPHQQEFALSFAALGLPDHPRPIALGYFHVKPEARDPSAAGAIVWPPNLGDDAANVQLLGGFNPDNLRFDPAHWITLRPQPR